MASLMRDAGFVDVQATRFVWPFVPGGGSPSTLTFLGSLKALSRVCLDLGGIDGMRTPEDADKMFKECEEDVMKCPLLVTVVSTVGRHPLDC
jgi:hypothetical protein